MSKQEISTEISPDIINSLILTGDMSKLTSGQQTQYYNAVCQSIGINPLTQPFAIIVLNGKKILYATKGCTQQLSDSRKITTEITDRKTVDSVYVVSCKASMPDGRKTDDDGIVAIVGLKGVELANAMMKAVTKAKRRAVLALCGLGMPDESEVEDITHSSVQIDPNKSRVEQVIDAHIEAEVVHDAKNDINPKEIEKTDVKSNTKAKNTKESSKKVDDGNVGAKLPQDHHQVIGVIEGTPKVGEMPNPFNDNKPGIKYNFTIDGKRYGTFDQKIVDEVNKVLDIQSKSVPIIIKFEYKERKSGDKIFNDIVRFSQATPNDVVPI